jgi:enamine deaminase RidA (YjgF/YER057c/UK114 family)
MRGKRILVAMGLALFVYSAGAAHLLGQQRTATTASLFFPSAVSGYASDGPTVTQQAVAALKRLENNIKEAGVGLDQIVSVRAYLVPGPNGRVDYAGWEHASRSFFNNTRSRPTTTTITVPVLEKAGSLIEIDCVVAQRNPHADRGYVLDRGHDGACRQA